MLGARQVSRAAEAAPSLATATLPVSASTSALASKQVRASTLPICVPAQEGDVNAKWRRALGKHNEGGQVTLLLRDEETGEMATLAAPLGTRLPHKEDGPGGELILARLASLPEHMDLEHYAFAKQPIETIQKGQHVVSRDPQTGKTELRPVVQTFEHPATEIVELELANAETGAVVDKLRGTPEHPFFTSTGIVPMGELAVGTQVHTRAGPMLTVKSSKREAHPEGIPVYNFEVEGDHTYFVGQANGGTWVHNSCSVPIAKFADYIFKAGATHGKDAVFRELGYGVEQSADLVKIYAEQGASKFARGEFTLGRLDEYGQRINIEIELQGIGEASGQTSYLRSGWMMNADGGISLNTPFAGFTQ